MVVIAKLHAKRAENFEIFSYFCPPPPHPKNGSTQEGDIGSLKKIQIPTTCLRPSGAYGIKLYQRKSLVILIGFLFSYMVKSMVKLLFTRVFRFYHYIVVFLR